MTCAHGLAVRVYAACLLRLWLMWLSFVPLSQRAWYEFLNGIVRARGRDQDVTPPFPLEHGCDALPVVLHGL